MAKYDPLRDFLLNEKSNKLTLTFKQIEIVIRSRLPLSAYELRQWWANAKSWRHVQTAAWDDAGWRVNKVNLARREVTFCRKS